MSYAKALEEILFIDIEKKEEQEKKENSYFTGTKTYAIVDAAKIEKLTNELMATDLNYENLFTQEDAETLEEVAPYLIELRKEHELTEWIYEHVYGELGSIFIHSQSTLENLAEILRAYITTTMEVEHPKKADEMMESKAYVRLYDPRVFAMFLESLEEKNSFFREIDKVYVENKIKVEELYVFTQDTIDIKNLKEEG